MNRTLSELSDEELDYLIYDTTNTFKYWEALLKEAQENVSHWAEALRKMREEKQQRE